MAYSQMTFTRTLSFLLAMLAGLTVISPFPSQPNKMQIHKPASNHHERKQTCGSEGRTDRITGIGLPPVPHFQSCGVPSRGVTTNTSYGNSQVHRKMEESGAGVWYLTHEERPRRDLQGYLKSSRECLQPSPGASQADAPSCLAELVPRIFMSFSDIEVMPLSKINYRITCSNTWKTTVRVTGNSCYGQITIASWFTQVMLHCLSSTMQHLYLLSLISCCFFFCLIVFHASPSLPVSLSTLPHMFSETMQCWLLRSAATYTGFVVEAEASCVWHKAEPDTFSQRPPLQPSHCLYQHPDTYSQHNGAHLANKSSMGSTILGKFLWSLLRLEQQTGQDMLQRTLATWIFQWFYENIPDTPVQF